MPSLNSSALVSLMAGSPFATVICPHIMRVFRCGAQVCREFPQLEGPPAPIPHGDRRSDGGLTVRTINLLMSTL